MSLHHAAPAVNETAPPSVRTEPPPTATFSESDHRYIDVPRLRNWGDHPANAYQGLIAGLCKSLVNFCIDYADRFTDDPEPWAAELAEDATGFAWMGRTAVAIFESNSTHEFSPAGTLGEQLRQLATIADQLETAEEVTAPDANPAVESLAPLLLATADRIEVFRERYANSEEHPDHAEAAADLLGIKFHCRQTAEAIDPDATAPNDPWVEFPDPDPDKALADVLTWVDRCQTVAAEFAEHPAANPIREELRLLDWALLTTERSALWAIVED